MFQSFIADSNKLLWKAHKTETFKFKVSALLDMGIENKDVTVVETYKGYRRLRKRVIVVPGFGLSVTIRKELKK